MYELEGQKSQIVCFNGKRKTLIARRNCEMMFSKNITIDHLGQITILLGDYFSFPDNFEKLFNDGSSEIKSIFTLGLTPNSFKNMNYTIEMVSYVPSRITGIKRGTSIGEGSIKELVGSSVEELFDSNRFETYVKKTSHVLAFKIIFDNPWDVSVN